MTDEFAVKKGVSPSAWKLLVYGRPGVGKSTWAAKCPEHLFLDLENGLERVDCVKTPHRLTSLEAVIKWLRHFLANPEYKTVIIDTIDELERFLAVRVIDSWNASNKNVKTIADIPYGRGGDLLVNEWKGLIDIFEHLHAAGKNVMLVGHEQINKFENPTDDNYDYYSVNIHKKTAPVVTAKLDAVFYAHYETLISGADKGKGKAVTTGRRVLSTAHAGSFVAKSRFNLPDTLPMDEKVFALLT